MNVQNPWRRFTLFCFLIGYILTYGVGLAFRRFELGCEHVIILAVGAWIVWLIVADLSKFEPQEPIRRGGWRRRYHHKWKHARMDHSHSLFDLNGDAFRCQPDDHVARIPASLGSRESLFDVLKTELDLPDYFGENWNALSECLRDLSWIESPRAVILHADLPQLQKDDLAIYLEVLADSVESWKPGEEHVLTVVFPENVRDGILEWENHRRKQKKESGLS
jgi:hypothetical protein